ncbi:hypothetical protein DPMN_175472 [Dreissena polymorpha]|uniref:Endonuclease/exonuclease/phosphatase domain-containing protein n=1 Tax=Dreissena polymorpha TaxID=45954 RepID=A0A9D4E8C2_DREPO|nr:hypothetical protein DPMN_175472 [Dreissena polymorpha]
MVIVKFKDSNQKFEIFNHRDALRVKGIRISNDLSFLQRQQIKKAKRCGLGAYFKNGKLVTFKPEENASKPRVFKRAVRSGDRQSRSNTAPVDMDTATSWDESSRERPNDNLKDGGQSPTQNDCTIDFITWNIEGLKSKLYSFDIIEFLKKYDVIGIQETWDLDY